MGKIQDDEVSMVNVYYVIKMLGSKAGTTAEGILRCFLENTMQRSRVLWRKIKKKLNLGVIAKIFEYSDGRYWIAADPDADVVIPSPSHSAHSSRCSTPERRTDGSDTSLPVTTPSPDNPDESSRPPRWLGEYLRLHVHSMRTERALQRYKILGGVKAHYVSKRQSEEARQRRTAIVRRVCRDASWRRRRRRATCQRSPTPVARRRRRLFVTKKRVRTRRWDHQTRRGDRHGLGVAHERNHRAVFDRLSKDVMGFVDMPRSLGADERKDVFHSDLKIDFSPKSTSQDVRSPLSSDVSSSSKSFGVRDEKTSKDGTSKTNVTNKSSQNVHRSLSTDVASLSKSFGVGEEKRSERDTLGHTSKTNATIKPLNTDDLRGNILKYQSLTVNPRPSTAICDRKSADDTVRPLRSTPKTSGGPKGAEIIRSLGMENLVTVVNNPMRNRWKLNKDGSRNDAGAERRSPVRDVATETIWRANSSRDSDDEDVIPNKRYKQT